MQKFSEFIKEHKSVLENNEKETKANLFNTLYEAKLREFGAKSIMDLDEEELDKFNAYVKTIKEDLSKADVKKMVKSETKDLEKKVDDAEKKADKAEDAAKDAEKDAKKAGEEVKDEKTFREYAESVLKKAHGDDYDEKIAKKVIDGIASKVKDDNWGEAIGRLTSGLGQ